jgi:uncharacterized metal-binding protein
VLELVGYSDPCGGLDNVASVIAELANAKHSRGSKDINATAAVRGDSKP